LIPCFKSFSGYRYGGAGEVMNTVLIMEQHFNPQIVSWINLSLYCGGKDALDVFRLRLSKTINHSFFANAVSTKEIFCIAPLMVQQSKLRQQVLWSLFYKVSDKSYFPLELQFHLLML
jgi:hypothetical protein